LWSQLIKARANFRCQWDPSGVTCQGAVQAAHIIRRRASGVRTDLSNGRCLCVRHHTWLDQHEEEWAEWVGVDEMRRLRAKADAYTRGELGTGYMFWRQQRQQLTDMMKAMQSHPASAESLLRSKAADALFADNYDEF
jgi:predicted restriction endonuclease